MFKLDSIILHAFDGIVEWAWNNFSVKKIWLITIVFILYNLGLNLECSTDKLTSKPFKIFIVIISLWGLYIAVTKEKTNPMYINSIKYLMREELYSKLSRITCTVLTVCSLFVGFYFILFWCSMYLCDAVTPKDPPKKNVKQKLLLLSPLYN